MVLPAGVVPTGSGSYTTTFPGTDSAGRNAMPPGKPNLSGPAVGKPVPTNDWWSHCLVPSFTANLFNYPLNFRTLAAGLNINDTVPGTSARDYRQPISDVQAVVVGTTGLSASSASVYDYSDWTVTLNWDDKFRAILGQGMPFMYFTKASAEVAQVVVNVNPAGVAISGNKLIILNNMSGANYVVYAPAGSTWTGASGTYTSTLNGQNYWSMAMLPPGADVTTLTTAYEAYAYVFPGDTKVAWTYTPTTGVVRTTFTTTPVVKEGANNTMLQGLLPHQWAHLASDSPQPGTYVYKTVRGQMKMLASNTFYVENKFSGILPTLPNLAKYSAGFGSVPGFDPAALTAKIDQLKNDGLALWTDSYNEGQAMNRLVQAARIADQLGYTSARDTLVATVKTRLENWFTASAGEVAFLFYYNADWTTLIGYPAGYSTDSNINDHHFHWGYFVNAAAMVEEFNPGWATQYGDMVNMLVRDTASPNRTDPLFPFLRNFNPYDGHAWGNGTANQPFGVDEESSPESMNLNAGIINWGLLTGNNELRDLGVYLYTTEQTAVEEYWFDVHKRTFQPEYIYPMVARLWAGGYDNGTWWTSALSGCYGIQMYPIIGGSLYLGYDTSYVNRVWTGLVRDTDVLKNDTAVDDPNCWYDVLWCYQAFSDPEGALTGYNRWQGRDIKNGISDAQTYHWLHTMHALGQVRHDISADYPMAVVFDLGSVKTYVAHNYGSTAITVHFSDGFSLPVPARAMATNRDITATVSLVASASKIAANGTVTLTASTAGSGITSVEFYQDGALISTKTAAPYTFTTAALAAGLPRFYAKVFVGANCNLSNVVLVQVGGQTPYGGTAPTLPGTLQAGDYDVFEGGFGQGVTYSDTTPTNVTAANGGVTWRPDEAVDAGIDPSEGHTVGWIDAGEWLTYTVNVSQAGPYKFTVDTASGNSGGGGPFWLELNGSKISSDITVPYTDTNWSSYVPTVATGDVTLPAGLQTLRLVVGNSGFNLGRMKFEISGPAAPSITTQPANQTVIVGSAATFTVVATGTSPFSYQWQKNGTDISGATAASYTTPATSLADSTATFHVVVTNSLGHVTSRDAVLTVNPAPVAPAITAQPQSITVSVGLTASFSVTATGTAPLSYQWRKNTVAISGATASSYTTPVTLAADNGAAFSVVVSNGAGSTTSSDAILTLSSTPVAPAITAQPSNASVARGQAATFTAAVTGSPFPALQWQKYVGGAWTDIAGATSLTYNTGSTTDADSGVQFHLVASNATGTATSNNATLTVTAPTLLLIDDFNDGTRWTNQLNSLGKAITTSGGIFNLEGNTDLYFFFNDGTTADSITSHIDQSLAGLANLVIAIKGGAGGEETAVTVVFNDGSDHPVSLATYGTLTTAYKNISIPLSAFGANLDTIAFLRIEGRGTGKTIRLDNISVTAGAAVAPTITAQPANIAVSAGQTATFTVAAAGTAPLSYQWKKNGTAISGATSASYTTPATSSSDNGASFTVVVSNSVSSVTSTAATLTISAAKSLDLNGDGVVDVLDMATLASVYGKSNSAADLNGSGLVDDADITLLLAGF